ncbi:ABC transporter permease [Spiroplasma endosymbiont of Labia minor]|uniref:ABC transporter permease n=1 Tax=Spiroplasma endosymbiont of Labia minor TaxID=3066305 RepID=UPI0030D22B5F
MKINKFSNSRWLLIKQGFMSLFRYKIQFIVILLLSFITSILLTASVSTAERLNNNFDQYVNSHQKFDYTYSYQVHSANAENSSSTYFAPFMDVFPDYVKERADNLKVTRVKSSYNINLFGDDSVYHDIFNELVIDPQTFMDFFDSGEAGDALMHVEYNPITNEVIWNKPFSLRNPAGDGDETTFVKKLDDIVIKNINMDNSILKDSIFYKYVKKHNINLSDTSTKAWQYLNFISFSIGNFLRDRIYNYFNYFIKAAVESYYNSGQYFGENNDIAGFFTWFNNELKNLSGLPDNEKNSFKLQVWDGNASHSADPIVNYNPFIYQLISGRKFSTEANISHFVGQYATDLSTLNPTNVVANQEQVLTNESEIYQKGYRGQLNVIICGNINNPDWTKWQVSFLDELKAPLIFKSSFESFNQSSGNNFNNVSYDDFYNLHQMLAADLSGFNLEVRNELFSINHQTNSTFRVVLIQNNDAFFKTNINIIRGRMPVLANEIVISPQYARKNKLKPGDSIYVGNSTLIIAGIGTDVYSFVPAADKDNPIPNVNKSAIIYALPQAWGYILDNMNGLINSYSNVFLTDNKTLTDNLDIKVSKYQAYLMNKKTSVFAAIEQQRNFDVNIGGGDYSTVSPESFNTSNYRDNWTAYPTAIYGFTMLCYIGTAIVFVLTMVSCWIGVKKNIERNSSQIAIMKAIGASNWMISLSYITYGLIITIFIVPIGWLAGIFLQLPFSEAFNSFFSFAYNQIVFSWIPFIVSLFAFGFISIAISLLSAFSILRKPFIQIVSPGERWKDNKFVNMIKLKWMKNAKFSTRFKMQVFSSSFKRILLMSGVIFLSSLLMTFSLMIPSIISNISTSFYKGLNYKNEFGYQTPIYNSPLSKAQISSWQGPTALNDEYDSTGGYDFNDDGVGDGQYKKIEDYFASTQASTGFALMQFTDTNNSTGGNLTDILNGVDWTVDRVAADPASTASYIADSFGNNFYSGVGSAFSIGNITGMINWLSRTNYLTSDVERSNISKIVNNGISKGVCSILSTILGIQSSTDPNQTWLDCTSRAILTQMPPYVSNYAMQSVNRQSQFAFGWNYMLLQDKLESLSTSFSTNINNTISSTIGMQNAKSIINPIGTTDSMFISQQTANQLQHVMNSYEQESQVNDSSIKDYYDETTNTLTVPVVANEQATAQYKVYIGDTLNYDVRPLIQQSAFKTNNGYQPLLKQFWVYNDKDYATSNQKDLNYVANENYLKDGNESQTEFKYLLNPFELQNNRFTYQNIFNDDSEGQDVKSDTYAFANSYFDNNVSKYKVTVRPYYSYEDLYLYLPNDNNWLDLSTYETPDGLTHNKKNQYVEEITDASQVPASVKKGKYQNVNSWLKIKPYSLHYTDAYDENDGSLANLLDKHISWLNSQSLTNSGALITAQNVNNDANKFDTFKNLKIKYKVVATAEIYGTPTFYTSNLFANLISGYDISKANQFNINPNTVTDANGEILIDSAVKNAINEDATKTSTFYYNDINNAPLNWFTNKYSSADEAFDLTTYYADSQPIKLGNYLITAPSNFGGHGTIVASQNLLSEKQGLINRITAVFISMSIVVITIIVVCAVLLILMITNLFVNQYERFMTLMKVEGYTKWSIANSTVNIFTPFVFISWGLGSLITWIIIKVTQSILFTKMNIALPLNMGWWTFLISFILTTMVFFASFILLFSRMGKNMTATLLREDE